MIDSLKVECAEEMLRPSRAHEGDAGLDLRSDDDHFLIPGESRLIGTGVKVEIPFGYVGLIFSRSGMAKHGITLANSVGVIDCAYRGEIKVYLVNNHADKIFTFSKGDRIAQLVIMPVALPKVEFIDKVSETVRGVGGFGSTGVV